MEITYKAKQKIKWTDLKKGSLFLTEAGELCIKLPELNDAHGIANCYCFKDNKYYSYKDYQEVGQVSRMQVII